jgi:hypothetical protein
VLKFKRKFRRLRVKQGLWFGQLYGGKFERKKQFGHLRIDAKIMSKYRWEVRV